MAMDLASLQSELKAAKEKWPDVKLGKGKKESEKFPYPVSLLQVIQQPPAAKAYDVLEIPVKLVVESLEPLETSVEVSSSEIPARLQAKIGDAVLEQWKKNSGKKAAPWGMMKTLEYVETNYAKLLHLDPECIGPYDGCDENGASMRRYAVAAPPEPAGDDEEEDSEEEDSEDEEAGAQAELARQMAALLASLDDTDAGGKKKLSPEEIERRKQEAAEMGEKAKQLSKEERAELNKTRKERSGHRQAKTGQAARKFEGEGSTSKADKKAKNTANVKKKLGLTK